MSHRKPKETPASIAADMLRNVNFRPRRIFLGLPSHSGQVSVGTAMSLTCASSKSPVYTFPLINSLLARCFNIILCRARDAAKHQGFTHFVMLHADVGLPVQDWAETLIDELEAHGGDLISACVPIKNNSDTVSVALDTDVVPWRPRKLDLKQLADLPPTFTASDLNHDGPLLVNTGCMALDLRKPWVTALTEQGEAAFTFTIRDRVTPNEKGGWNVEVDPEDWAMSRTLHGLGCKVLATTKLRPVHYGYESWQVPGWVNEPIKDPAA